MTQGSFVNSVAAIIFKRSSIFYIEALIRKKADTGYSGHLFVIPIAVIDLHILIGIAKAKGKDPQIRIFGIIMCSGKILCPVRVDNTTG